jgi:hypothetical protein
MLDPATNAKAEDATVFAVPEVEPPAVNAAIDTSVVALFEIVMVDAAVARLIPAPAIRVTLEDDPFKEKLVAAGTAGPMMVNCGLVEDWLSVIFDPATKAKAEDEAVFAVPEVAPPAVSAAIDTRAD